MSENRKTNFIRQGTILAMASIIVRMIGIVYRIPVANIIGDEGNGIYGAAYEIYNLALILSSYSLPLAVSKLLSAQLAKGCYRTGKKIFTAALIFSCISGGLMALLIFFGAAFIETHFYSNFTGIAITRSNTPMSNTINIFSFPDLFNIFSTNPLSIKQIPLSVPLNAGTGKDIRYDTTFL